MYPQHSMNGGPSNGSAIADRSHALVPVGAAPPPAMMMPWGMPMGPSKPAALSSGPTPMSLIHALRRRWLPAVALGTLVASITAACTWFFAPLNTDISAWVKLERNVPSVLPSMAPRSDPLEFERYKATQANMVISQSVLQGALQRPGISQLPLIRGEADPVKFLQDNLDVRFPGQGESMQILLAGEKTNDVVQVVNAVTTEYVERAQRQERRDRINRRDTMRNEADLARQKLEEKQTQYVELSEQLGALDKETAQIKTKMLFDAVASANRTINDSSTRLLAIKTQIADIDRMLELEKSKGTSDADIDNALRQHPEVAHLYQLRDYSRTQIAQHESLLATKERDKNVQLMQLKKQLQYVDDQITVKKSELGQMVAQASTASVQAPLDFNRESLSLQAKELERNLAQAEEEKAKTEAQLAQLTGRSADLQLMSNEVDQLMLSKNSLQQQLSNYDVEIRAHDRVSLMQEALPPTVIDRTLKYVIVGFFSFAALALAVFSVSFLEFQARRISNPADLSDGLGLRIVGSLPALRGMSKSNGRGPSLHGLLSASIDGVRTALLHSANIDGTRVVLISSAGEREGRTTLASQLAASLARAGRRTLLVDADVRSPTIHRLFELPLDPGLCEVLRGEVDLDDAIRPTRAPGLWMMASGQCCQESIQAMAQESMRTVFDRLRPDFDFIVIDGCPALSIADSLLVGQYVDAAILSVMRDVSQLPKVYEAAERLRSVGIRVLGSVVHGVKPAVSRRPLDLPMVVAR